MRHHLLLFLLLAGCSSINQTTQKGPLYTFRADMQIGIGENNFDGMGVWKLSGPVQIQFISPVNIDRVQVTSCARQRICQSGGYCDPDFVIDKNWLGTIQNTFAFNYIPVHAELEGLCPLYIEAYSKQDLTSWGFVGFRDTETMPAHIDCNGAGVTYAGLTTCQTKNGLEQLMSFSQKVAWASESSCHATTSDQQNFKMVPDKGFCRMTFQGKDAGGAPIQHRLILLGYDSVLVREN